MTTQHIIYPTRYAGTTLVSFADNFERAHEIFMNVMDVAVVCVDIPRSELCVNCAQAHAFFERGAAENEAHETSARRMADAADLIEAQAEEIARLREALAPYAEASKMLPQALTDGEFLTLFNDAQLDAECILGDYDASPITAGHLRRAAAVLREGGR